ncbi:hypothetical protein H0A65_10995 [Alcaligenaceae bacterium]|nr:hypothetical protein [Alcaligenaceae bacterium]
MNRKSMRVDMPQTAAFIDSLREAFGADMINEQIRQGIKGAATFYARENGHELGTPLKQGDRDAKD